MDRLDYLRRDSFFTGVTEGNIGSARIIKMLDLRRPIYRQTAAYGHFGRTDVDLPWEKTDKAELLKKEAGL